MNFELEYDVVAEDDAELQGMLGEVYTLAGPVTVESDGYQAGEVCTVFVRGPLAGVVAWLEERAIDSESLLQDLQDALASEALHIRL